MFDDIYFSDEPISSTYLNRVIKGQNSTPDGKTQNTPLWEIKNLMVTAIKKTFWELEQTGKVPKNLVPSKVFGFNEHGENNYNEIARDIVIMIDNLNDNYGSYKNSKFENMFNKIFSKPVVVDNKERYLRIVPNAIYNRTNQKVRKLFEEANYKLPLDIRQREKFKQIYIDAYINLIEGKVEFRNGKRVIVKESDLQIALNTIEKNHNFNSMDFISTTKSIGK